MRAHSQPSTDIHINAPGVCSRVHALTHTRMLLRQKDTRYTRARCAHACVHACVRRVAHAQTPLSRMHARHSRAHPRTHYARICAQPRKSAHPSHPYELRIHDMRTHAHARACTCTHTHARKNLRARVHACACRHACRTRAEHA